MNACTLPGQAIPTSTGVSAALALIQSMEPKNELEAAVAVDIACLHAASSIMLSRLSGGGGDSRVKTASNAVAKLQRAFTSAIDTYRKLKHGNRQTIRIEKVVVESGGQAVVGNVATK